MKRLVLSMFVATFGVASVAGPAFAGPREPGDAFESVRPTSNPLAVIDGGWRRGDAVISFRVARLSTGLKAQSAWKLKDTATDGNLVHGTAYTMTNAGYCYSPDYVSCSQEYYKYGTNETPGWGGTYRSGWFYEAHSVPATATYARLSGKMCMGVKYWPDPCDGYAISSGWRY